MGLRILSGELDGGREAAVLYCSTSMRALPFIFDNAEAASAFCEWLRERDELEHFRRFSLEYQSLLFAEWQGQGS